MNTLWHFLFAMLALSSGEFITMLSQSIITAHAQTHEITWG